MDLVLSRIARTGFLTSVLAYALFWIADSVRPGFVARYLSIHIFLIPAILFGWLWSRQPGEWREQALLWYLLGIPLGFLAAAATWNVGAGFGDARLLAVILAAITPVIVLHLIKKSSTPRS